MEAGTKAFVSYVRAYKEHHCKFIFRLQVQQYYRGCSGMMHIPSALGSGQQQPRWMLWLLQDLSLGHLATSFALLRLPRMPEIKKSGKLEGFTLSAVDPETGVELFPCNI